MQWQVKGAPDPAHAGLFAQTRHHIQHGREQMRVFVSVEVGGCDTGGQYAIQLRAQFSFDVQSAAREQAQKPGDGGRQWLARPAQRRDRKSNV